jgi:adenylate cyclase class 2
MKEEELEVKLYVDNLKAIEERLKSKGATPEQARVHEINLRFDTRDGELSRSSQVLRLRKDTASRLTYKGPGEMKDGVKARRELEFTVGDFDLARAFLEALGYQVILIYEKYRATYMLEGTSVSLDELPYGNFVEIEGPDSETIHRVAGALGVDWDARIPESYTALFDQLRQVKELAFRDLTFENFTNLIISVAELGVRAADGNASQ